MSKLRFRKAYVEITNVCNLHCSFCPGTARPPRRMSPEEFRLLAVKLRPFTDCLYLHLMGEPLSHPRLAEILRIGTELGFRLFLTTNGTLLGSRGSLLLGCPAVEKVSISLHSFEANPGADLNRYLSVCLDFAAAAGQRGMKCALRLWNLDGETTAGENELNGQILAMLERRFPKPWMPNPHGTTLAPQVFLEWGERFRWPDLTAQGSDRPLFCRGLRDQVGVLADGTVVPCCLDHNGEIPLGNLFRQGLDEILETARAEAVYRGFSERKAAEPLCRTCGFARRF